MESLAKHSDFPQGKIAKTTAAPANHFLSIKCHTDESAFLTRRRKGHGGSQREETFVVKENRPLLTQYWEKKEPLKKK